jgi:conjugative relaxase-like TrwC/TraI family protein
MITVGVIRNGGTYLAQHLRKNDYWQEGEKEVLGEWIGQGAQMLGLEGVVADKPSDALCRIRHPDTGKRLTARENKSRMALFDIQLSAPKDVSVLAMVGGDVRVLDGFLDSAKTIVGEMERYVAVRERRGMRATRSRFV